ncbi:hypothetical protein KJ836_01045 [Patescibacteria group bacterium]|nr:hypothetical protein [Patescibacteria group bacterium]
MNISFGVKVDIEKDAWNIWQACNRVSHGVDWSKRAEPEVIENVAGKTETEAYAWLLPYLEHKYQKLDILVLADKLQSELMPEYPKVVEVIERITQKPFHLQNVTLFLTTFNRCPYDSEKGYVWIYYKYDKNKIINTLLHELLHFQFHHYYEDDLQDKVSDSEWEAIKEGMTVILNDDLANWTGHKEITYSIYEDFAKEILELWHGKADRQFDKFVAEAVELVKKHNFT